MRLRTQRHADADFARAFLDKVGDDAVDADEESARASAAKAASRIMREAASGDRAGDHIVHGLHGVEDGSWVEFCDVAADRVP